MFSWTKDSIYNSESSHLGTELFLVKKDVSVQNLKKLKYYLIENFKEIIKFLCTMIL